MQEALTFDDVLIVPKFSDVESRADVDLSTNIRSLSFKLPIISANMDTVTNGRMAQVMLDNGAQACLHRFGSVQVSANDWGDSKGSDSPGPMVSIGLGDNELSRAKMLFALGAHTFIIDVAHGAQEAVRKQVTEIRRALGNNINLIVGNFASVKSVDTFLFFCTGQVDGIKVGIGPGSACTTRIKTGVGYPQFSAVQEIAQFLKDTDIKVIADGGMRTSGDIAKALGAGAHAVMLGGMLAGTDETPGKVFIGHDNERYKWYRGSASKESYAAQGKDASWRTAEGESFCVPAKGPVANVLRDIEGGLRSSFTYVGASNLEEFHRKVEFVRISGATMKENGAHGKKGM